MSTKRACDRLSSASREPMAADTWPTRVTTARGGGRGSVQKRGRTTHLAPPLGDGGGFGVVKTTHDQVIGDVCRG